MMQHRDNEKYAVVDCIGRAMALIALLRNDQLLEIKEFLNSSEFTTDQEDAWIVKAFSDYIDKQMED